MQKLLQLVHPTAAATLPALAVVALVFLATARGPAFHDAHRSAVVSRSSGSWRPRVETTSAAAAAVARRVPKGCDIFRGEWVPDDGEDAAGAAPYYTNLSCPLIQEHQNCMKYGRPDRGFLRWRWRPDGCELPRFEAAAFLDAVRNTSLAFVGDSIARNHMQSLMCLLSKVAYPKDISKTSHPDFRTLHYESHNFTLAIFWSPFLVRANQSDHGDRLWHLHLDEPDRAWVAGIAGFDRVILSAANWFNRPSVFHEAGRVVGCHNCQVPGVPELSREHSLRMAFRTVLHSLSSDAVGFNGTVIVRTLSPTSHFEGGEWNKGGDCRRTRPYAANETRMAGLDLDFHTAQVEEFARAKAAAQAAGRATRLVLMDTMTAMLLRPDGHPSRYGHWPHEKVTLYNDCVHWCLPGPIDVWNEMLLQMLLTDSL
ncbi:hypothetical protein ACP70R_028120 [Stipagrostis hirtigluma subsp. patula]